MSSLEVVPMPQLFRPALRASNSVPSGLCSLASRPTLQRADTVAEFVDLDDRIMGEECEDLSSPVSSSPLTPLGLNKRSSTPSGVSTRFSNAIQEMPQSPTLPPQSPLVFSAPRPSPKQPSAPCGQGGAARDVQHEPNAKHQPHVPQNHSDSLVLRGGANVSPFTFEHPFLVRPRNVRGKHPLALAPLVVASETKPNTVTAHQSERRVHNPYSFTTTLYDPSEDEAESLSSSEPNSPTSSSDDSARLSAHEYTSAPNTLSSHSSTNSMSSEWSTPESTQHTHVPEQMAQLATAYPHMVSPVYGGPVYCRPQPYAMPPQAVCGPYCGHHHHHHGAYPACSVTVPAPQQQTYYIGYEYCASPTGNNNMYQQQHMQRAGYNNQQPQYLCVPSSVVSSDSHSESDNGISDDGRSVLSANASLSVISGIDESSTASVMGTEGVKKKRYRARCPTCSTTPDVKRLRFKRGFTYFVCLRCHFKWRLQGAK